MEKPVATDPVGIRKVLATAKMAKAKKLNVVVGLQRHYQTKYIDIKQIIDQGAIGKIRSGQVYWNDAGVWVKKRQAGQSELEYQNAQLVLLQLAVWRPHLRTAHPQHRCCQLVYW